MLPETIWSNLLSAILFSAIGLVIFIGGLALWDRVTPQYDVWRAIFVEKNLALAVLVGSFAIGIALIIAAAVHG